MLKIRLSFLTVALCASLFAAIAPAQEPEGIVYLHLRRDAAGITLLRSTALPGHLKKDVSGGDVEYEIGGELQGRFPDPLRRRFEYEDPVRPGQLRSHIVPLTSVEFTLRVPGTAAGRSLRFFQRAPARAGGLKSFAERQFLGEITIPAEMERMRSFATAAKVSTLLTNGPTSARLNVVILAEGFTVSQEASFTNHAKVVLEQFLDTPPYDSYRGHFNGFAIFVPSAQAGSDHPSRNIFRDTYFNSSYESGGLARLITIPPNDFDPSYNAGHGKADTLLNQLIPDWDIALLLVNDEEYGGSGGIPAITSINSSAPEIAIHEIGHSFANLGDEYESAFPGYPDVEEPNTTRQTNRDLIKWLDWIDSFTPIPTPGNSQYAGEVGLFEGAHYQSQGWFRPKFDCKMRSLNQPFCEVCQEALVLSAYTKLGIIQASSPVENNLTVPGGGEIQLRVSTVEPIANPLSYTWTVDGVTNDLYRSNVFPASFATLGLGARFVRAQVQDTTPLVRTDSKGALLKSRSWQILVLSATNDPPVISGIPDQETLPGRKIGPIGFTVSDPSTPVSSITITASSSNTNVIRNEKILIGRGPSISLTTEPGDGGVATISIFANDGHNTTVETFNVAVTPLPIELALAPIPDQKTFGAVLVLPISVLGQNYGPLTFVATTDNPALIPEWGITVWFADGIHRITLAAGMTGQASVTVSATDGEYSATTKFNVHFLARPQAQAAPPEITTDGIRLRFTSDVPVTMILETSTDMKFWTPIATQQNATTLDSLIPSAALSAKSFYRLRLVPL